MTDVQRRYVALIIAGVFLGVVATLIFDWFVAHRERVGDEAIMPTSTAGTLVTTATGATTTAVIVHDGLPLLALTNQPAGDVVMVARVELPQDGWLVVHEVVDGHVANALGAARKDAGTYEDIPIELLRKTDSGGSYVVILYVDDHDKEFDLKNDIPIVDPTGNPVMQQFMAQ